MALPVPVEMKPLTNISVAVATLDRPSGLASCLDAIRQGDLLPGELIVVDQSASQSAKPVVARFEEAPYPVHYIHQQQRGLSASRNAAIERAVCPYIAFTDDDCVPDQAWIASLERAFHSPPLPAAISGRVLPIGPESPELFSVSLRESKIRVDFIRKTIPWIVGTGGNLAIQRPWLDRVGKYDERLGTGSPGKAAEDADMIYRLLRSGGRIRYEPDVVMYHHRQSISKRMSSRWNYGFGIGAFCALWLRRRDLFSAYLLASWFYQISGELVEKALQGHRQEAQQRLLSLRGTWKGLLYGFRVKSPAK